MEACLLIGENSVRNIWNKAAEAWADFVRKGKDHYRIGLNNPAVFEILGDIQGLTVLDLACGEGYNTRILAGKGAKTTGVDFSPKMVGLAKQEEARRKLGIEYFILDAMNLKGVSSSQFDLVTCFMALQDIENFRMAILEVSRVLKPNGRFVFSIPHPCFELPAINGEEGSSLRRYFEEAKYSLEWNMKRLAKPFKTITFHRTLTHYFDALNESGLHVSRLVEPRPTREALQKYPPLEDVLSRPQSLVVESAKTNG